MPIGATANQVERKYERVTRRAGNAQAQVGWKSQGIGSAVPGVTAEPAMRRPTRRFAHIAAVVAAALIWSTSYAVAKRILAHVGPLTSGSWRFLLAAAVLAVVAHARPGWARPRGRQLLLLGVSGLLGITVFFAVENIGLNLATASDAALIVAAQPLMAMCIEFLVLRARLRPIRVGGVILAMVGVVLIVRNGAQAGGTHRYVGDVLMLLNSIVWAGYTFLSRMSSKGIRTVVSTYYQTLAGAAGFLLAAVAVEPGEWRAPSVSTWALVGYLAVFCSVAAFLLYNYGLTGMTASTAVNLLNLVPVFGLVSAVAIAGESVDARQVGGGLVVILGVALGSNERTRGPAPASEPPRPPDDGRMT